MDTSSTAMGTQTPVPTSAPASSTASDTGTTSGTLVQYVDLVPVVQPLQGVQNGLIVLNFFVAALLGAMIAKAFNWFKW